MTPPFDRQHGFHFTQTPNPEWQVGEGAAVDEQAWRNDDERKVWDVSEIPVMDTYRLLTTGIIPRPVAFVSTVSEDGIKNLAPFSYFAIVGHNPPMISVSCRLSPARPKDTRENILSTKEFTVNIISEPFVEAANSTSIESPADMDEWILSGLTPHPSVSVRPPIVKESAFSMECELYHHLDISPVGSSVITTTLIVGSVKRIHIRHSVLGEDGKSVDPAKFRVISRLGGPTFGTLGDGFAGPKLEWSEDIKEKYAELEKRSKSQAVTGES